MKGRMLSFVSICMIPLMMALTNFSTAEGPGNDNGTVPADSQNPVDCFFQAGYSYVFNNDDVDATNWISGMTVWDVYYKEAPNDPTYDYFIKKATIAWVKLDWIDQTPPYETHSTIYPHADSGDNGDQLRLEDTTLSYSEGNTLQGGLCTEIEAHYSLDVNDDQYSEFEFDEWFTLHKTPGAPGGINGGYIDMRIAVLDHPPNWQITGETFTSMEFGFVANADIYDAEDDEVNIWNPNVPGWEGQETETGPIAVPYSLGVAMPCVKIMEDGHHAVMIPGTNGESWADYYLVNYHASGEYSREPSNYVNDESLNGQNGNPVMWYVCGYNIALNNFPPNGQNGLYTEVYIGGFTV